MKRAQYLAIAGLGLVCMLTAVGALADQEPNDDYASAEQMPGGTVTGTVTLDTDEADYYKFTVSEGQYITVTFKADTGGDFLYGTLSDWDEWTIIELKSKDNVVDSGTYHTSNETVKATWYLYVDSDTEGGNYEFTVTLTDQDDGGLGKDAGGAVEFSDPIDADATVSGLLADADEEDWYRFQAGEGDIIKVTLTSDSDADFIYLDLVDWEDWTIFELKSKDIVMAEDVWYTALEGTTAYWYLRVHMDTDMGNYQLTLEVGHQDDADTGTEAPGDHATAMELAAGTWTGHLEDEDDADCYKFQMGEGDRVHVTFSSDAAGDFLYMELADWEGWTLWELGSKDSVEVEERYLTANETQVTWYYLVVGMDTAPGGYEMAFEVVRQDDAGSGEDVPGTDAEGHIVQAGTYTSWVGDDDGADAYRIAVEAGWTVTVTLTNQGGFAAEAGIIGESGMAPLETLSSKDGTVATWEGIIEIPTAADGYLYVVVAPGNPLEWMPGAYQLEVAIVTTPADTEPPQMVMDKEPTKMVEGKAKTISVTATDNEGIEDVTLYFRIDDEVVWNELAMTADGDTWSATIPKVASMDAVEMEYVIVAWDTAGNNVTYGDWTTPKAMKVTEPPEDDGPGFGVMLAVAALAALTAVLVGRRGRRA